MKNSSRFFIKLSTLIPTAMGMVSPKLDQPDKPEKVSIVDYADPRIINQSYITPRASILGRIQEEFTNTFDK